MGYYQEDLLTNPEDPTPGAFVLSLPENDASFSGAMFFTFVGCQHSNVGNVKGVKAGFGLSGTWSGTVDNSAQSGPYSGTYDAATGSYNGVYSVSAGKQFKKIEGCIQYYIGPHGTWEMFPVEQNQPPSFKVAVAGTKLSWSSVPNAAMTLVYVIDPDAAKAGASNPVKFQTIVPGKTSNISLAVAAGTVTKGKEYIVAALVNDSKAKRVAFGTKRFVVP
ncbi:hypothetical protein LP419_21775 [Massilia sp. H-1]|nr:hypothetical protein LP419_21775 [Massilia sp. H-1]